MSYDIRELKSLTTIQYDTAKERALKRVKKRIGDKPERQAYERDLGRLWTLLDTIAAIVFLAAFAISSAHIIQHAGSLAEASYKPGGSGITFDQWIYVTVHQIGFLLLAESAMLLFMVMHGITLKRRNVEHWTQNLTLPFVLAFVAMAFVVLANVESGLRFFEAVMPPVFTIGIGFRLEHLIIESIKRREDVTRRYVHDLEVWEKAIEDATTHPDYAPILKQEIWEALVKKNKDMVEAPMRFKHVAVVMEMRRDQWAYQDFDVSPDEFKPDAETVNPTIAPPQAGQYHLNGNGATATNAAT